MTNMQRLVLVLAFIFAVLLGILLATSVLPGNGSAARSTSSPGASLAASVPPTTAGASGSPSASAGPSASASASPSPTPSPTPKPIAAATVKVVQFALDAASDTSGTTRAISFTGLKGTVTVKLATQSGGSTKMCLYGDSQQLGCKTTASGSLTGKTTNPSAKYRVTLRGSGAATPVVTVTITFPAQKPSITITNARFDGTATAAYNGLQVVATPRANGTFHVNASWGGHPFLYEVDLIEQGGGPGLKQVKSTSAATKTSQNFAVTAPHAWMIVLKNSESGFGPTGLAATFSWP